LIESEISVAVTAEQDLWRKKLAEAELEYQQAATCLRNLVASSAGAERARAAKMSAREEYLRVLRIFTDLVLRGKSPRF
jgi:hypothetical protein